jgi:hypothetical protein
MPCSLRSSCAVISLGGLFLTGLASAPTLSMAQTQVRTSSQREGEPPVRELREEETVSLAVPPPTAVVTGRKCDSKGNIYLVYSGSVAEMMNRPNASWDLPITRVPLESDEVTQYPTKPMSDYHTQYRESFNVDRWGTVYGLVTAFPPAKEGHVPEPDHFIIRFKDDGSVDSTVQLTAPKPGRFTPDSFDVFSDGSFLVTGIDFVSADGRGRRPLTGIFDRSGRFIRELTLTNDVSPDSSEKEGGSGTVPVSPDQQEAAQPGSKPTTTHSWAVAVGQGGIISGPDGNLYLLRASDPIRLYGISPGGEVIHQVEIRSPEKGLELLELSFVDERSLFVEFSPVADGTAAKADFGSKTTLGLIDLETGKVTAIYQTPANMFNLVPGCPISSNEFSFLGTGKDGKLALVKFRGE